MPTGRLFNCKIDQCNIEYNIHSNNVDDGFVYLYHLDDSKAYGTICVKGQ